MKQIFKAGDKVYFPDVGYSIYVLNPLEDSPYVLLLDTGKEVFSFTSEGKYLAQSPVPSIFPATKEYHKKLSELYGIDFEDPDKVKSPREIIQAMLDDGWKSVPCMVTDMSTVRDVLDNPSALITRVLDNEFESSSTSWKQAFPVDPKTGKQIIDYVNGQIITE